MDIMGVPSHEIGKLQYEGWGARNTRFIQIDELVMREAVKRKLNLQNHYINMMIYGYINQKTFQDIRTPIPKQEDTAEDDASSDEDEDEEDEEEEAIQGGFGPDTKEEEERGAAGKRQDIAMENDGKRMP